MSAYAMLNAMFVNPEDHSKDARAILDHANAVVDHFYCVQRTCAGMPQTNRTPFLLISFDKITFGTPGKVMARHVDASSTGKVGKFVLFPEDLTSEQALRLFTFDEFETRVLLVMMLIHLRQIEDEGPSHHVERLLENTYERFRRFLEYCLHAYRAN